MTVQEGSTNTGKLFGPLRRDCFQVIWEDYLKSKVEASMKEQVLLSGEGVWRTQTKTPPVPLDTGD